MLAQYIYIFAAVLMGIGLLSIIISHNLVKKLIGLGIFQTSVLLIYISLGYVSGSKSPILDKTYEGLYSNPLPHVLMLTAIVVGIATLAVGLALSARTKENFSTIEETEIAL